MTTEVKKKPSDDELIEAFTRAARDFMGKPDGSDPHYSTAISCGKYVDAKRACLNAGIPESVLQEVIGLILAERGGVSR